MGNFLISKYSFILINLFTHHGRTYSESVLEKTPPIIDKIVLSTLGTYFKIIETDKSEIDEV